MEERSSSGRTGTAAAALVSALAVLASLALITAPAETAASKESPRPTE